MKGHLVSGETFLTQNTELLHLPLLKFHAISNFIAHGARNSLCSPVDEA